MNAPAPLTPKQLRSALVCFNRDVLVVEETPRSCRLRVKLRHGPAARLYGRFFPLRDHHNYILDGLGLVLFNLFREKPVRMEDLAEAFQNEHKLSWFEAFTLVREYIGRLMRRGIVVLEITK